MSDSRREAREREKRTYKLLQVKLQAEAHQGPRRDDQEPLPDENDQRRVRFSDRTEIISYETTPAGESIDDQESTDTAAYSAHSNTSNQESDDRQYPSANRDEHAARYILRDTMFVASGATVNWTTSQYQDCRGSPEPPTQTHDNNSNNDKPRLMSSCNMPSRLLLPVLRHPFVVLATLLGFIAWFVLASLCDVIRTQTRNLTELFAWPFLRGQAAFSSAAAAWRSSLQSVPSAAPFTPTPAAIGFSPIVPNLGSVLGVIHRTESGVNALSEITASVQRNTQLSTAIDFLSKTYEATNVDWMAHLREEHLTLCHLTLQLEDFAESVDRVSESRVGFPSFLCRFPMLAEVKACRASPDRFLLQLQVVTNFVSDTRSYRRGVLNQHMTTSTTHRVRSSVCKLGGGFAEVGLRFRNSLPAVETSSDDGPETDSNVLDRVRTYLDDQNEGLRMSCRVLTDVTSETADKRKHMGADIQMLNSIHISLEHVRRGVTDDMLQLGRACKAVLEYLETLTQRLTSW